MLYRNPLQFGSDPFAMLAQDGYYYILCSGWRLYRSPDLVHYEDLGAVYTPGEDDWFYGGASAPELYYFHGKYWIFHTTEAKDNPYDEAENRKIGVLVADKPEGPYHDPLGRPLYDPEYCPIDINVYEEHGRFWLYWAHSCYHHPVGRDDIEESWIYGAEMKPDFTGLLGEPKLMIRPVQAWEGHTLPLHKRRWNEGPFVMKHGNTYYMMFSANTFEDYGVGYATADCPMGPWVKAEENPILAEVPEAGIWAPGHNSIVASKDGEELFMVYHMITDMPFTNGTAERPWKERTAGELPTDGYALQHWPGYAPEYMNLIPPKDKARKIAIDRIRFTEDGRLELVGPTVTPQPYPSGNDGN